MATSISDGKARIIEEKISLINQEVSALTSGIDTSKINLKVNRGNRYLGVVFEADGSPAYKVDPDDGSRIMAKITGDSGWQFTDALFGLWKSVGPTAKLMAWQWSDLEKCYVPSRTKYKDGVALRPAGILDELVERKMQKSAKTSMPGLAEISFLVDKANSISREVKADKENVKKGIAAFSKAHKVDLVKYSVIACKGIGIEKDEFLRLLSEFWPELFSNPEKQKK